MCSSIHANITNVLLPNLCVPRAPSSRRVGSSLTSSPVTSTSRNRAQMSTHTSSHFSTVSNALQHVHFSLFSQDD